MNQDVVIDSIECFRKVNKARSNNRLRGLSRLQPLVNKTHQSVGGIKYIIYMGIKYVTTKVTQKMEFLLVCGYLATVSLEPCY